MKIKTLVLFFLALIFACSSIVLSGLWKDKKSVRSIEFVGGTTLSKDEVFDFAKLNDSIIMSSGLSLETIEARISKHPNIKNVVVSRESAVIKIEISEKDPFAIVTNGKKVFFIDDKLNLYNIKKENTNIDLPVINGFSESLDINNYEKVDMKNLKIAQFIIKQALKIDKLLYNYISEINFSDSTEIILYSSEDATPIYFLDYDGMDYRNKILIDTKNFEITNNSFREVIKKKLIYLDNFLKQVIVYKNRYAFKYIDMRYQDIVLVKNNNNSIIE